MIQPESLFLIQSFYLLKASLSIIIHFFLSLSSMPHPIHQLNLGNTWQSFRLLSLSPQLPSPATISFALGLCYLLPAHLASALHFSREPK